MIGLEGIRVIEIASYIAGPACARLLGELGASVTKVEPLGGDDQRAQGAGWGVAWKTEFDDPAYDMAGMNKEWVSINLKDSAGLAFLYKLVADCDILVTNYRDQALRKLGIDYDTIHARFPHVVWAQMRGYGERGAEKDSKGFDATAYAARGGIMMSFPQAGEHFEPVNFPAAFGDWNAAMALASGALAALVRRLRTGEGDKVTVNLYHCACYAMTSAILARQQGAAFPKSRRAVSCPSNNSYCSRDGVWFLLCQPNYDRYFAELMALIGREDLADDARLNTQETISREGRLEEVTAILAEGFAREDFAHWERVFRTRDVPYQKLFTLDDILADPEAYQNDILRRVHYEQMGDYAALTTPVRLKSVGDPVWRRARPIGYDTAQALRRCGYSAEAIRALDASGAVRCYAGEPVPEELLSPIPGGCAPLP